MIEPNPFVGLTYAASLDLICRQHPDRLALVFEDRHWTFAQIKREIDQASAWLAWLGLRAGDKLALWLPNRPEFLWLWLGAAQSGLVVVVVNTRLSAEEAAYQLEQSDSAAVIVAGDGAFRDFIAPILELRDRLPLLRQVIALDPTRHEGVVDGSIPPRQPLPMPAMATDADAPALISYSSGTTALPKGALLTHCVFRKAWDIGTPMDQTADDRLMMSIPLFGSMAMLNGVLLFWVRGGAIVVTERFEPERFLQLVERERCTFVHLLPPMVIALAGLPGFDPRRLSGVRVAYLLSNDRSMFDRVHDTLGISSVILGYGLTESTTVAVRNRWDDPREVRGACQGYPLPGVEVAIADEAGAPCPPGTTGEILLRGYCIMKGYYRKAEQTARAIDADGWLHTGDCGLIRDDGRLSFLHRLGEGYKTNGFNVSPAEVEAALRRHPDVQDVAVYGRSDPVAGQVGVACVIPREGARIDPVAMVDFVRPVLASYKLPRHIAVVESFPMTGGTSKVQKRKLKEEVEPTLPTVPSPTER